MLERTPLPRWVHPRVWLISIPMSLLSVERRQRLPKLPIGHWRFLGIPLLLGGVALWLWARAVLAIQGDGSPDPDNPPRLPAEEGPYRYTRNPMMIAGLLLLSGVSLIWRSLLLLCYVAGLAAAMHVYIVRVEEPELLERFGESYRDYRRRVPRWLPLRLRRRV